MPIIPDQCRLGVQHYVSKRLLDSTVISAGKILYEATYYASDSLAREVFTRLATTHIDSEIPDQVCIKLDCVVLTPDQLDEIIRVARIEGAQSVEECF